METLKAIVNRFDITGEVVDIKPLGNGLINDTYKVITSGAAPDYVLQRINNAIFRDVELLQHNIESVTDHIRKKLVSKGEADLDRKVLRYVKIKDADATYCCVDGKYWRVCDNTNTLSIAIKHTLKFNYFFFNCIFCNSYSIFDSIRS